VDVFQPTTTACGDAGTQCTNQDFCSGTSAACTDNGFKAATTSCAGTSQGSACDNNAADHCSGTNDNCVDVFQPTTTTCGDAESQCTNQDFCSGTSAACTDNGFKTSSTACGDQTDTECNDPDTCSGTDGTCVNRAAIAGTSCGSASDTTCTDPDTCNGTGSCQPNNASNETTCDDGQPCTIQDSCSAGLCAGIPNPLCLGGTCNFTPPVVAPPTGPSEPVAIGSQPVSVSANFTDPGDTAPHTCTINWGDNTSSAGTVTEPSGATPGTCTGTHTYGAPNVYEVTITVTDFCGSSGSAFFHFIVIFDPTGGFVTGGGWINSPLGACTYSNACNPGLTGKADFGFVSKYKNSKSTTTTAPPEGETQFHFNAGNFKFDSDAYEYLIISGAKARYRGTGQINGAGSYGFELTAWDGQAPGGPGQDMFRIKIWQGNPGNAVYDNERTSPDGEATTALGGGSIVIHKAK
jgi:hypothetical protein